MNLKDNKQLGDIKLGKVFKTVLLILVAFVFLASFALTLYTESVKMIIADDEIFNLLDSLPESVKGSLPQEDMRLWRQSTKGYAIARMSMLVSFVLFIFIWKIKPKDHKKR